MTQALAEVVDDLATLIGSLAPGEGPLPTPCPDLDVAGLRDHVLSWLPVFAAALADPDGTDRPDPAAYRAPEGAAEAAAEVRGHAASIGTALAAGVADRPVRLTGDQQPGRTVVAMLTAEVVAHGWDLARATGRPWSPPADLCDGAREQLSGLLLPQYRGPGRPFGLEVPVPDGATSLDRLLAFSGRDPGWAASRP